MGLRYSLLALSLAACGGATSPSGGSYTPPPPGGGGGGGGGGLSASVTISGTAYSPSGVTVKAGGIVTWTNNDAVTHSVTSDAAEFSGGDLGGTTTDPYGGMSSGGSLQVTFGSAGTYAYHCNYHSTMHGTVTVSP